MKVVMNYADNTALVSILYDEKEEHSPVLNISSTGVNSQTIFKPIKH